MKLLKGLAAAAALTIASFSANSAPITVGGVTWDPDSTVDFTASINFVQLFNGNPVIANTELFGFGRVASINTWNSFCLGCELTFSFGNFLTNGAGGFVNNSGYLRVYVDNTPDYDFENNPNDPINAVDGPLWLELLAQNVTFFSTVPTTPNPYAAGFLSVTWLLGDASALAFNYFQPGAMLGGFDAVSSTAATFGVNSAGAIGSGDIFSSTIPEPTSIALLGLGLLGLVGGRKFRKA